MAVFATHVRIINMTSSEGQSEKWVANFEPPEPACCVYITSGSRAVEPVGSSKEVMQVQISWQSIGICVLCQNHYWPMVRFSLGSFKEVSKKEVDSLYTHVTQEQIQNDHKAYPKN